MGLEVPASAGPQESDLLGGSTLQPAGAGASEIFDGEAETSSGGLAIEHELDSLERLCLAKER
jgi:hypothetical protein